MGSGNQELAIVPFINPVTNPSRTELFITPELAELLAETAPVRVLEVTGGTEVELEAPVPVAEPSVTETEDSMLHDAHSYRHFRWLPWGRSHKGCNVSQRQSCSICPTA